jgi:hypothetical protein
MEGAPDIEGESKPGMVPADMEAGAGAPKPGIDAPPPIPLNAAPPSSPESKRNAGESVPILSAPAFSLLWVAMRKRSVSRFSFSMSACAKATCSNGSNL